MLMHWSIMGYSLALEAKLIAVTHKSSEKNFFM
jgi:hypothetical protein